MRSGSKQYGVCGSLLVLVVGGAFACLMLVAAERSFTFADQAIAKAGETPPPSVEIRLGTLFRMQKLARASLGLGLMGLVLGGTSYLVTPRLRSIQQPTILGGAKAGGAGFALGVLAGAGGFAGFNVRSVGDQDLVTASVVQGFVWALLGAGAGVAVGLRSSEPSDRYHAIARGVTGGFLWGVLFPPLHASISPWSSIEQLIPESRAVMWAWSMIGVAAVGLAASGIGWPGNPIAPEQGS